MRRYRLRAPLALLAVVLLAALGTRAPIMGDLVRAALAHDVTVECRETLGAYGRWIDHPRWGEAWVPADVASDWRPYRLGHWIYTDEWGWYWVADEAWGWIAYHYGRWVRDRDLGWVWLPGSDWGPAWVSWRRGEEIVGWAPMPPDEIAVAEEGDWDIWLFVRVPDLIAPSIADLVLPIQQTGLFMRQTVIINRAVGVGENGRAAVTGPGVPPAFVAARIGRPIQSFAVQPHVLRGTAGVTGAIVGAPPKGVAVHEQVNPTATLVQPAAGVPPPAFQPGSPSNLGPHAPHGLGHTKLMRPSARPPWNTPVLEAPRDPRVVKPRTNTMTRAPPPGPDNATPKPAPRGPPAAEAIAPTARKLHALPPSNPVPPRSPAASVTQPAGEFQAPTVPKPKPPKPPAAAATDPSPPSKKCAVVDGEWICR